MVIPKKICFNLLKLNPFEATKRESFLYNLSAFEETTTIYIMDDGQKVMSISFWVFKWVLIVRDAFKKQKNFIQKRKCFEFHRKRLHSYIRFLIFIIIMSCCFCCCCFQMEKVHNFLRLPSSLMH